MRSKWKVILNLSVTATLLAVLCMKVDWGELVGTLKSVWFSRYLYSCAVLIFSWTFLALRLQALLRPTPLRTSWFRLLTINLRSQFYGLFLPSGVGTAAARWYLVTGNRVARRLFVFVTALERLMLTIGLVLCSLIPLIFASDSHIERFRAAALPVLILMLVACCLIVSVFFSPLFKWFSSVCQWCSAWLGRTFPAQLLSFHDDIQTYRDHRGDFLEAVGMHVLFQSFTFLRYYFLFECLRITLAPVDILWISALGLLVVTVPLSFAGLGMREATFALLLALYGYRADQGALLGALISSQVVITGILGGVLNLFHAKDTIASARGIPEDTANSGRSQERVAGTKAD